MSVKVYDKKGRWRNYSIAFRMSKEEHEELTQRVELSGLTKQEYMIRKALDQEITVTGNMRTYRALRNRIDEFILMLDRCIEQKETMDNETLDLMLYVVEILKGLSEI